MQRIVRLVFVLVASCSAASAVERVAIVLDASGATNRPGLGGDSMSAVAREAVAAVAVEAPSHQLRLGLRLAGGDRARSGVDSCSATSTTVPVASVEADRWYAFLDAIEPHGLRPLVSTVVAAAAGGEVGPAPERVVVVVEGDDQCGRLPQEVVAALAELESPPELRLVGLDLDLSMLNRYSTVPHRNASSPDELVAALRWAVFDDDSPDRGNGEVWIRWPPHDSATIPPEATFHDLATGSDHAFELDPDERIELPAGRYRMSFTTETDRVAELWGVTVVAGLTTEVDLNVDLATERWLDPLPPEPQAGGWLHVGVIGDPPDDAALLVTGSDDRVLSPPLSLETTGGWLTAPSRAGTVNLLVLGPSAGGSRWVLSRSPVTVGPTAIDLDVPDEAPSTGALTVIWTGPGTSGDAIALVPRDGTPMDTIACVPLGIANEVVLATPEDEGQLDVVYVDGASWTATARAPIRITGPAASVVGPTTAAAGDVVEITWEGPERDQDFLCLAPVGSADGVYLDWRQVNEANPLPLEVPTSPGAYEIRYVDGTNGTVRARAPLEVTAVAIELRAPTTVVAGRRFEVEWTGPAADGDFIAIALKDTPVHVIRDWASVSVGSPVTLAAPSQPGSYEIRYVTGSGRTVAVSRAIEVTP